MNAGQENSEMKQDRTGSHSSALQVILIIALIVLVLLAIIDIERRLSGDGHPPKWMVAKVQISNFETALDAFHDAVGRYPTAEEGLWALVRKPVNDPGGWERPFMRNIPLDPWGYEYQYMHPGTHNVDSYDLCCVGPDGKPGGGDDITNWGPIPAPRAFARYTPLPSVVYELIGILLLTSASVYLSRRGHRLSRMRQ